MRKAGLVVPVLFALVVDVPACKEPEPENVPGKFGDPCVAGEPNGSVDGCVEGLVCWQGYCEETCVDDLDCTPVDGWTHGCVAGQCQIYCGQESSCPDSLGTPMECWVNGMWCASIDES